MENINKIYCMDAIELLRRLDDNCVNMVLVDLPYQETGNKWDAIINLRSFFDECRRILKEDGCIALTGTLRFGIKLIQSAEDLYKYDWIWVKDNGTNAPNTPYQPFRVHEFVFIFGKGRVTNGKRIPMKYNSQKTKGEPYKQKSGRVSENWKGGLKNIVTDNPTGERHPLTIQYFCRDKNKLHPTQKPVELFKFLIKSYTDEGDLVVDCCAGSGTTAVACKETNRNFVCNDNDEKYVEIANKRLNETKEQLTLIK